MIKSIRYKIHPCMGLDKFPPKRILFNLKHLRSYGNWKKIQEKRLRWTLEIDPAASECIAMEECKRDKMHLQTGRRAMKAEPLKKKKKVDPNLVKAREERKRKRIMKEITKLQRKDKELKPIAEFEIPPCLEEEKERRRRIVQVPKDVAEERILLLKQWTAAKFREGTADIITINSLVKSQRIALQELRLESEELYQAAVKIDESLIPFKTQGPTETPPNKDYPIPDGAYIDVSKKWT